MSKYLKRLTIEIEDLLRFSEPTRSLALWRLQRQAASLHPATDQLRVAKVAKLCAAARLVTSVEQSAEIEHRIREVVDGIRGEGIDWTEFYPHLSETQLFTAAILKPYIGPLEKGVLLISFERQWIKLLMSEQRHRVHERYTLVLAPSWTPPHSSALTVFPKLYPDPVFCTISHDNEMIALRRLSERIIPVPLLASNWVQPEAFQPLPQSERDVDVVMVATFGKYKRHHALFRALRDTPKDLRVLLVGTRGDFDNEGIRNLARAYGVEKRLVDVRELNYGDTSKAFCRAKISVIMSRREGSCQAVVESMFANTPVGILDTAELGSRKYINENTGATLRESRLAEDMMGLIARAPTMSPRQWVIDHDISCHGSTRILNRMLMDHACSNGQEWTQDIALHRWNPQPTLVRPEDEHRIRPAYRDFYERYGLGIGSDTTWWTS